MDFRRLRQPQCSRRLRRRMVVIDRQSRQSTNFIGMAPCQARLHSPDAVGPEGHGEECDHVHISRSRIVWLSKFTQTPILTSGSSLLVAAYVLSCEISGVFDLWLPKVAEIARGAVFPSSSNRLTLGLHVMERSVGPHGSLRSRSARFAGPLRKHKDVPRAFAPRGATRFSGREPCSFGAGCTEPPGRTRHRMDAMGRTLVDVRAPRRGPASAPQVSNRALVAHPPARVFSCAAATLPDNDYRPADARHAQ
jgi:hypothetical protein